MLTRTRKYLTDGCPESQGPSALDQAAALKVSVQASACTHVFKVPAFVGSDYLVDDTTASVPVSMAEIVPGTSGGNTTYTTPAGDFSTLLKNNTTGVFTRTLKSGMQQIFNSSGYQTSLVDLNVSGGLPRVHYGGGVGPW